MAAKKSTKNQEVETVKDVETVEGESNQQPDVDVEMTVQNESVGEVAALDEVRREDIQEYVRVGTSEVLMVDERLYKAVLVPFSPENFPEDFDEFGNPK